MGISSNFMVELEQEEIKEKEFDNIITETAYYVVYERLEREEAYKKAKELNELRKDPNNYIDTGDCIEYLDCSLKEPIIPADKKKQIEAVKKELYDQFEYDK
jgi:hypothetical protein